LSSTLFKNIVKEEFFLQMLHLKLFDVCLTTEYVG
jgi:hypothetical protein